MRTVANISGVPIESVTIADTLYFSEADAMNGNVITINSAMIFNARNVVFMRLGWGL
jgi:hypothetical protein